MNKKRIEFIIFFILNIFLSSYMLSGIILLFLVIDIGYLLTDLFSNFIVIKDDLDFSIMLSIYLLPVIAVLFKLSIFPIVYKIKFFNNIKELLRRFANDKTFFKKMLLSILIFDITIYIFSELFAGSNILKNYTEMYLFSYILFCGGVFPCYLFFLLWYKLTHKNKKEIIKNQ